MLLRKRSSVVATAEDGVQALKEIDRSEHLNYFDLVFMDNTMPNMVRNKLFCIVYFVIIVFELSNLSINVSLYYYYYYYLLIYNQCWFIYIFVLL